MPTGTWKRVQGTVVTCQWCRDEFDQKQVTHRFCRESHRVRFWENVRLNSLVQAALDAAMRELAGKLVPSPASRVTTSGRPD